MKHINSFLLGLVLVCLIGCGGTKPLQNTETGDIPEWYLNPPKDPNYLIVPRTETSLDMQMAVDKATTGARAEIGRQVELKLQNLQKKFAEEVGTNQNATLLSQFTDATKIVVSQTLNGTNMKEQKIVKDGNTWRAYVLMQYPLGSANQVLMDQLKKNNELYTRYRQSQTFQDAEKEWDKLDQEKKDQQQK